MTKETPQRNRQGIHLHFVGVGGIGMSGIAEVLYHQGYSVSGSDLSSSDLTERLKSIGMNIFIGHDASHVQDARVVVISSAVSSDNVEVMEARRRRIPVVQRAEILGELMRGKTGIAVGGTHGKTTTTSILATILTEGDLDPTIVIGGKVDAFGGNAKLGTGSYVVAEADESDGSFLHLPMTFSIVTNIDQDHLDHFKNREAIDEAFIQFIAKLPFYGFAVVCGDDPGVKRCLDRFSKPIVTYGFNPSCDYVAQEVQKSADGVKFQITYQKSPLGQVELGIHGDHNVLNALGAVALSHQIGVSFSQIQNALKKFKGVKRRFEICWSNSENHQLIVDDYGHHPTEIRATLAAARDFWKRRIVSVYQPHRYTRTDHLKKETLFAFEKSDVVLITDIYPAGEKPIPGVSSQNLVEEMKSALGPEKQVIYAGDLEFCGSKVLEIFQEGDLLICFGAGSITKLSRELCRKVK